MNIRQAAEADASALIALRTLLFTETDFLLWEPEECQPTLETEINFIKMLTRSENSNLLLAFNEDGELIGFMAIVGGNANRIRHNADVFLGVQKKHWRQGVARQLFKHLFLWVEKSSLMRLELTTAVSNIAAYALYRSVGFKLECVKNTMC